MLIHSYRELPLETLSDLLVAEVSNMLRDLDTNQDKGIAFKARRKHVEVILAVMKEKQKKQTLSLQET